MYFSNGVLVLPCIWCWYLWAGELHSWSVLHHYPHGYWRYPYPVGPVAGCTGVFAATQYLQVWINIQGVKWLPGCTARLHHKAALPGCTARLHRQAAPSGRTGRPHRQAAPFVQVKTMPSYGYAPTWVKAMLPTVPPPSHHRQHTGTNIYIIYNTQVQISTLQWCQKMDDHVIKVGRYRRW